MNVRSVLSRLAALAVLGLAAPVSAQQYAYIPNYSSHTVSVVDTAANSVTATIGLPGASGPHGVAANTAGTRVYISNFNNNTVSVIDTSTNTASAAVAIPGGISGAIGIAVNPSGTRAYVVGRSSNNLAVFDLSSTPISHITTLGGLNQPWGLAVNADGSRVYVASRLGGRVDVLNTASNTFLSPIATPGIEPFGIALDTTGNNAWVSHYGSPGVVVRISNLMTTPTVGTAIPTGGNLASGIAVNASNNSVYVANEASNSVTKIDVATGTASTPVATGASPRGVGITPNGGRVLVTNISSNSVTVFDANLTTLGAATVGSSPYSLGIFIAQPAVPTTADITGTITNSLGGGAMSGVTVANSGAASTSTNVSGVYSFADLASGSYTITPSVYNYTFSPTSRTVNLSGTDATGQNFVGTYNAIPDTTILRDLVVAANLSDTRLRNNLLAPLNAALNWLNGNDPNRIVNACSNLAKFISLVRQNYSAGKLSLATRDAWVADANDILALSGCPTR